MWMPRLSAISSFSDFIISSLSAGANAEKAGYRRSVNPDVTGRGSVSRRVGFCLLIGSPTRIIWSLHNLSEDEC